MTAAPLLLALCFPIWAASDPIPVSLAPKAPPSPKVAAMMREAEREIALTEPGRRLLAMTGEVLVVERRDPLAPAVRYSHGQRALVVNPERLMAAPAIELELDLVRERKRASVDVSIPLVEDEQAAYQEELAYALQKAAVSADFDAMLRSAFRRARAEESVRLEERERLAAAGVTPGSETDPRTPRGALVRLGFYLYLFSEDPDQFYWIVERDQTALIAVRLDALSDFMQVHEKELSALKCPDAGRYCRLGDRSYPRSLARAALAVRGRDGIEKIKAALGPFHTSGAIPLRLAVRRWEKKET